MIFFKKEELDAVRDDIEILVQGLAEKRYNAGKNKDLYKEYGLFERLTKIEAEFPGANILLQKVGKLPQSFRNLWSNERLLNVIKQLIGPDITCSPVWNLRTTTPNKSATVVPWHQVAFLGDLEDTLDYYKNCSLPFRSTRSHFLGGSSRVKPNLTASKFSLWFWILVWTWIGMFVFEIVSITKLHSHKNCKVKA